MRPVHLNRIDPDRNMARFYRVDVTPNLFGEASVLRSWGRIGTWGRMRIETFASTETAEFNANHIVRAKMRRGYSAVASSSAAASLIERKSLPGSPLPISENPRST